MTTAKRQFNIFFVSIICLLSTSLTWQASAAETVAGQRPDNNRDRYEYRPIDKSQWQNVANLISAKKASEIFELPLPHGSGGNPPRAGELDEMRLNYARGLVATGDPIHAQYLLTRIVTQSVGTRQSAEALRMIYQIAKAQSIDDTFLEDMAFDLDAKIDDPEARSMIAYYRARALMRKGFSKWALQSLADVEPKTTWASELQYDRTMQTLDAGDSANAYTQFEMITRDPEARRPTADMAKLALARLIFERTDYGAAIATYKKIDLPTRERARSLNELAWSYYYDRAYGKALGAIKALKSPYYQDLLSPETYILEMLIYRELCHYQTVKQIAGYFVANYKSVYSAIEERRSLENVPQFLQMSLQEGVLQRRAYAIQQVRSERKELRAVKWKDDELRTSLIAQGEKRERIIDFEIGRMLKSRIDKIGNWFLDLREQVWFLEYESSMRMIQMNEDQSLEGYQPPQASSAMPDEMFWPVNSESWFDELLDYDLLVTDMCRGGKTMPNAGGGRK